MLYLVLSVVYLVLNTDRVEGACTKFSSYPDLVASVVVQGRCVYGFSNTRLYYIAKNLCWSEDAQPIVLRTAEDQRLVYNALGSAFDQHWVGLKKRNGVWEWQDDGDWFRMTSSRWESQQSNIKYACTISSANRYLLKMATDRESYRAVCEESSATSPDSPPTDSPPTDSPSQDPAPASPPSEVPSDSLFTRKYTLENTVIIDSISVVNIRYCVLQCLRQPDCTDIVYKPNTPNCILTKQDSTGNGAGFICTTTDNNKCFTKSESENTEMIIGLG